MRSVGVTEAKAHLSRIVSDLEPGETVTITKRGVPVAQLAQIHARPRHVRSREDVSAAIDAWRAYRSAHNITLGADLTIMDLIREGRRG